jgi:flagellin
MTVDMTTMGNTVATLLRTGMIDFNVSVAANDGAAMLSVTFTAPVMTDGGGTAVRDFQFMTSLNGMTTGNMALTSTALNGAFVLSRAAMSASATANFNPTMDLTLNLGGTGDAAGSITVMITEMSFMAVSTSNMTTMPTATSASGTALLNGDDNMDFTFKVGTGTDATQDEIAVSIGGISTNALGIENSTIATKADADAASEAVSTAIDTLQEKRSEVGAAQNRLDFAGQNVELTRENQEAARSELEDLNVAKAITAFSQEQLLVQAGTSVLGQANQLPQNLLQLFR